MLHPPFLFSVDLEDVHQLVSDAEELPDRVEANTERYLDFLRRHAARCTFFTTGDVARRYPALVKQIAAEGHEIACHTSDHLSLHRHDPDSFRDDLERCLEDYARVGIEGVTGFRAPFGSMTGETRWAYEVLREMGFRYSSSVLAARNRMNGWPDFGPDVARKEGGLWELPVSLSQLPGPKLPFAAGVYFRVLPFPLVRWLFRGRLAAGKPVVAYFHPQDVDVDGERFMYPEIGGNRFLNWLLYRNRDRVVPRLEQLMAAGAPIVRFVDFVEDTLEQESGRV